MIDVLKNGVTVEDIARAWASIDGKRHDPETVAEIACNMIRGKQTRNEARQWPDWRTASADSAIEHVK